jgi:hypothetical protein
MNLTIPTVPGNEGPLRSEAKTGIPKSTEAIKLGGLFDHIQKTLTPDIFSLDGVMLPHVRYEFLNRVLDLVPLKNIKEMYLIGSTTGYQWTETSDIDINVTVDPPELADHTLNPLINKARHSVNGKELSGTRHPINFFLVPWQGHFQFWGDMVFGVYDIMQNKWAAEPGTPDSWREPEVAFDMELRTARQIQRIFLLYAAKYHRAVKKLSLLKTMPESWEKNWQVKHALAECKARYKELVEFAQSIDAARKFEYSWGWGIPRRNWRNIVFKLLEASTQGNLFEDLKETQLPDPEYNASEVLEGIDTEDHLRFPKIVPGEGNQGNL